MTRVLLDPTGEVAAATASGAARLATLDGATVALLDISKPRSDVFLDRVEQLLSARGVRVTRFRKHSYAKVADDDLRRQIAESAHAVIEALAD